MASWGGGPGPGAGGSASAPPQCERCWRGAAGHSPPGETLSSAPGGVPGPQPSEPWSVLRAQVPGQLQPSCRCGAGAERQTRAVRTPRQSLPSPRPCRARAEEPARPDARAHRSPAGAPHHGQVLLGLCREAPGSSAKKLPQPGFHQSAGNRGKRPRPQLSSPGFVGRVNVRAATPGVRATRQGHRVPSAEAPHSHRAFHAQLSCHAHRHPEGPRCYSSQRADKETGPTARSITSTQHAA